MGRTRLSRVRRTKARRCASSVRAADGSRQAERPTGKRVPKHRAPRQNKKARQILCGSFGLHRQADTTSLLLRRYRSTPRHCDALSDVGELSCSCFGCQELVCIDDRGRHLLQRQAFGHGLASYCAVCLVFAQILTLHENRFGTLQLLNAGKLRLELAHLSLHGLPLEPQRTGQDHGGEQAERPNGLFGDREGSGFEDDLQCGRVFVIDDGDQGRGLVAQGTDQLADRLRDGRNRRRASARRHWAPGCPEPASSPRPCSRCGAGARRGSCPGRRAGGPPGPGGPGGRARRWSTWSRSPALQ